MSSDNNTDMREFMVLVEAYAGTNVIEEPMTILEETKQPNPVLDDLKDLVFKLRAHTENDDSEKAAGIEEGIGCRYDRKFNSTH
jgi:hypothetical protein